VNLYGIGVDMVNIDRIQRMHDKYGNGLAEKLLHPEEMKLFDQEKNPVHFIANRFAGKEAAAKAFGTGFSKGITWKDFGFIRMDTGKPKLVLSKKMQLLFNNEGIDKSHVSFSDEPPLSIAFVVLEGK
jgi:holo-[acyl-carrier protein] synthase|tara:strand:- start:881 stop:1264 length:384 start_codon:yes stop_codon:yes gene_type:complete